jgi:AraC-like DNA-binding protein
LKPELEQINLETSQQSFRFFRTEVHAFNPFWHYHPELELTLITKGKGTRFVGDSIAPFSDYDLVLIGKNVPHHWVSIKDSVEEKQSAIIFQFERELFSNFKECDRFKSLFDLAKRGIHFENPSKTILKSILDFEGLNTVQKLSGLLELINNLQKHKNINLLTSDSYALNQRLKFSEAKFSKINTYILEHLHEKLTVNHMAKITHMVPQSFCRWFKKHSGHSFVTFLNITRIEHACHLLITTSDAVQDIAFSSGFESISHFNRTFKKIKGESPRNILKTYRMQSSHS